MKKKIIFIFVMTLLIVTVGMMNLFPSNNSLIEKTGAEDYMMTNWYERQKLVASDSVEGYCFGWSVSIDGYYALIAHRDDTGKGSAYVFKRDGTIWTEEQKLLASDGVTSDYFGISVSIDGDYALIGACYDDTFKGSAYVFKRDGNIWTEEQKLLASDRATSDYFGISVSIDGDYALIGAYGDDTFKGSAYVFTKESEN